VAAAAAGAADGSWGDAELGAFLMGVAIRGLGDAEAAALTQAMLASGEQWRLADTIPNLADKHSTGGVGDTISIVLAPLLAAQGVPVAMLTGRGLGHTAGTADKLESIPGLRQEIDRAEALRLLRETGIVLGVATASVAPADRRLYALRDRTSTVESLPLIVASILSKKLATGAAAIVFDVKTGEGAFLTELEDARALAQRLVGTASELGVRASALVSDMSQPLGEWSGHAAEVREALDCLEGGGPEETVRLTVELALELGRLLGESFDERGLRATLASGRAREAFARWAVAQGAEPRWFDAPELPLAPSEQPILAARDGVLCRVATRRLGELLGEAGGARRGAEGEIDRGVALRYRGRLGRRVEAGEEIARVYLRTADPALVAKFEECFEIGERAVVPPLIRERIG
jgi:pyrimidine-nucleoside phosphorylase